MQSPGLKISHHSAGLKGIIRRNFDMRISLCVSLSPHLFLRLSLTLSLPLFISLSLSLSLSFSLSWVAATKDFLVFGCKSGPLKKSPGCTLGILQQSRIDLPDLQPGKFGLGFRDGLDAGSSKSASKPDASQAKAFMLWSHEKSLPGIEGRRWSVHNRRVDSHPGGSGMWAHVLNLQSPRPGHRATRNLKLFASIATETVFGSCIFLLLFIFQGDGHTWAIDHGDRSR